MTQQPTEHVPEWTLGWRMQRALAYAGITTEQIAEDLDVSRSTVSRWLNDRGPVRRPFLVQFALRCGVPMEWLTGATHKYIPAASRLDDLREAVSHAQAA